MSDEYDLEAVSLREFKKLRRLLCEWKMLLPLYLDSDVDEPLEDGFHNDDKDAPAGFDVRTILPESLQELYLHGAFDDDDWENLTEIFEHANAATPNLDKVCIRRHAAVWPHNILAVIGDAPDPGRTHQSPLARLFDGHGYS